MVSVNFMATCQHSLIHRWISEKMDGIRAYWDGQKLWTRQGLEVIAPEITSALPSDIKLDGELWMGRESFHQLVSQFQSTEEPLELEGDVRLAVFDVPSQTTK